MESVTPVPTTPPPALVVVAQLGRDRPEAGARPGAAEQSRLLRALPAARRVLEIGWGGDTTARAYKRSHPNCEWVQCRVDALNQAGPTAAAAPGSAVDVCWDGSQWQAGLTGLAPDLVLLDDALAWLNNAPTVLRQIADAAAPDARLVLRSDNHANLDMLERLCETDLTPEPARIPGVAPRWMSPASIYKQLMDAGWMPSLADRHASAGTSPEVEQAVRSLTHSLHLAPGASDAVRHLDTLLIEAVAPFRWAPREPGPARFDVIVPTTQERQLNLNVLASPGLVEVDARVISYRGARHAAEALEAGAQHGERDWILLCHQDVYFPAGFGEQLNALLAAIPDAERARTLLGFIGMGALPGGHETVPSGFVIDRLARADHAGSDCAVSIDELAIVLSRDSVHRIDPDLGWHLWATDLCLNAICNHQVFPRLLRLPLFHNSRTGWDLPAAFHASAEVLQRKWQDLGAIPTLCGVIDAAYIERHQRQAA